MGKQNGFTLLELLVVIAIIAILVAIVLVAIDPARRINEANDRSAASNVRATGTLLSVCVTQRLSEGLGLEACANDVTISDYGTQPAGVITEPSADPGTDDVCAAQQGSSGFIGHYYYFQHSEGEVFEATGDLATEPLMNWCP